VIGLILLRLNESSTVYVPRVTFDPVADKGVVLDANTLASLPASVRPPEKAIAKHDEWAAAISSSGLVLPSERAVREAQVTGSSGATPLFRRRRPVPWASVPVQATCARLSAEIMAPPGVASSADVPYVPTNGHVLNESFRGGAWVAVPGDRRFSRVARSRRVDARGGPMAIE
jgi:hypothetical protein